MRLQFLGANRQVTGSRYCLHLNGFKVMIDCGLFQERSYQSRNWDASPIAPSEIDALLITHAHIDHIGLIPRLVNEGFRGRIVATRATADLAEILLRDSAKIQKEDAEYKKRRHKKENRKGKYPEVPLYTIEDVEETLPLIDPVPFEKPIPIAENITVTFHDAGHILGSAMIELNVVEDDAPRRIVFSGDIGQWGKPLIRDPSVFEQADYIVMESTYGDRDHENGGDIETQLEHVVNETVERGGRVIIPTFAVKRAQELMYHISRLVHKDRIPDIEVFVDSPMAVDVTETFHKHRDSFDAETWKLISSGHTPLRFPGLQMARSIDQSKAINKSDDPAIIMATSGMCTAGRIKHHLRRYISSDKNTVLFVGYQAHGTLGRRILNQEPEVRIHGRNYDVRAHVAQIYGFSGHADRAGLLYWASHFKTPPRRVFLTHGEQEAAENLAETIRNENGWDVSIPDYQDMVNLT